MTLKDISLSNLRRRKTKAFFVLAGLLIGTATVVALFSLVDAMTRDINHKLETYGANILIVPKTENLSLTYGGLSLGGVSFEMQEIHQEDLKKIYTIKNKANLAAVGPLILGPVKVNDRRLLLAGVDFKAFQILRPWWGIKGSEPGENGVLLGSEAARILGANLNDRIPLNGREFRVSGILEKTGSQDDGLIFTPLVTGQTILRKKGKVSMAEVAALCSGCPIPEMVEQISQILPGAQVMAIQQVVKGRMETLSHFQKFSYGVSALVLLIGCLVVLVTMTGSVRERTVEIGIFRAMGFRRQHVMQIILIEAGIVSALAGALGYLLGLATTKGLLPLFTESHGVTVAMNPLLAGAALTLAVALGLASSIYPALLAANLDPNEALRAL